MAQGKMHIMRKTLRQSRILNSSTLSVIGVARTRCRKRFRRPRRRKDRQNDDSDKTGSGNASVIAAIDSSTPSSYSTSKGFRRLSSTVWTLETTSGLRKTGSTIIRRRPTFQTTLSLSPSNRRALEVQRRRRHHFRPNRK